MLAGVILFSGGTGLSGSRHPHLEQVTKGLAMIKRASVYHFLFNEYIYTHGVMAIHRSCIRASFFISLSIARTRPYNRSTDAFKRLFQRGTCALQIVRT